MTVHPRTGDIAISWLDRRNDSTNCNYDVYATLSTDGGTSWAANFPISDHTDNPSQSTFLGDYTGVTFTDMGFFSAWPSSRNDVGDVYAAWWNRTDDLALTYPNGGEVLAVQEPCSIRWTYRYAPDTLLIELNGDYPSGGWDLLAITGSDSGYWVWTPPPSFTMWRARLRISGLSFPMVGDTSDADFAVGLPVPRNVTAYRIGNDISLRWQGTVLPYYHIYSSPSPDGPFTTLEGSTSATTFLDFGAAAESLKFYIVKSSTEP
jgi:hypothetical protein